MIKSYFKKIKLEVKKRKRLRLFIGAILISLGVIGIIMPILPGWIFVFLGFTILFGEDFMNKLL